MRSQELILQSKAYFKANGADEPAFNNTCQNVTG